jgi:hypothetical protein
MIATRRRRGGARLLAASLLSALLAAVTLAVAVPAGAATAQPADVTVMPGASATFRIDAPAVNIARWYRVGSTTPVATNTATYTLPSVSAADDGAQFYATYYDAAYSPVTTRTATLTVGEVAVGFAADPQDASVFEGRRATFEVTATGTSPFTYQWQTSGDDGTSWQDVAGATGASVTLRPGLGQDGDLVRALVGNPVGDPTPSAAAHLTVRAQDSASVDVEDASLLWGLNAIYQGGNPAGNNCNYFSAGTQLDFAGVQGDVRITHETPDGLVAVSDGTKCIDQSTTGMQQRVLLTHGEGTADPETGVASIQWHGAFLANAYGGLVPWWLEDLRLTVERDGTGTLTATAGGYGSDMDDPDEMHPIDARPVTVATFQDVEIGDDGITVQPDYAGVEITVPDGADASPQDRSKNGWGGWPQSFVDFHFETGLSSYWYSSGLSADPDKPAYPFSVSFEQAPDVLEVPAITASPALVDGPTIVNGRSATVTTTVENADSIAWERSTSTNGPWTAIDGATSQTLAFTASSDWNNKFVRVVATNSDGTAASAPAQIKTQDYAAPAFSTQPADITAIAGHRASLTVKASGFPAVPDDGYRIETSTDGGTTWKLAEDAIRTSLSNTFALPHVSAALDGALVRVTASTTEGREAGSPGSTVTSDAVRLTVVPATGDPQLAVVGSPTIDPTQKTTITVVGAGFTLPAAPSATTSYSLDLALFEADGWKPGTGGLTRVAGTTTSPNTWIGGGAVYGSFLEARDGTFSVNVTIPANTLDPTKVYGVGAYSRLTDTTTWIDTWDERSDDAWTPVLVQGQSAAQITAQPQDVDLPSDGGTAHLEVGVSGSPAPSVTWERRDAGATEWTAVDGAETASLDVPVTAADDGSAFRAVVGNRLGAAQTSREAVVSVAEVVTPTPTVTLEVPATSVYGTAATVTVQVPESTGTVTLAGAGEDLSATLADGSVTFTLPATLAAGEHELTASYAGDSGHGPATGTATLTVAKATPSVTVRAPAGATAGRAATVSVSVPGATGTVTLVGAGRLTATLVRGTATVRLPAGLAVGRHALTVAYPGDANHGSARGTTSVTVAKAAVRFTRVAVTQRPTHARKGRLALRLASATALPVNGKVTLRLTHGSRTRTVVATVRRGTASVRLPALAKGVWRVRATYRGSATLAPATASTRLRVTR